MNDTTDNTLAKADDKSLANTSDLQAYEDKLKEQQNQKFPASFNFIKVCYDEPENEDEPNNKGKIVLFNEGDTEPTVIGEKFKCTILARRHQYIYNREGEDYLPKEEQVKTNLFEDWGDEVNVYKNGVMIDQVNGISKWMKENYPHPTKEGKTKASYISHLYVDYKGTVYLIKAKGASCPSLFDMLNENPQKMFFQYPVNIFVTKEQRMKGAPFYYPMNFEVGGKDYDEATYRANLAQSYEVSRMISALNNSGVEQKEDDTLSKDEIVDLLS